MKIMSQMSDTVQTDRIPNDLGHGALHRALVHWLLLQARQSDLDAPDLSERDSLFCSEGRQ